MELFKAKESIKIAVAWFTNELLLQPLILKLQMGVSVEIVLNDDEINRGGDTSLDFTDFLQAGGILRWNDSKQLMHEKFCIIDDRIVITGSYNWTNKAELNSEVENFFYDEEETTVFYNDLYHRLSERFEKEICVVTKKEEILERKCYYDEEGFYIDEQGAKYSNDRKCLIKVPGDNYLTVSINRDPVLIKSGKCPTFYHIPDGVTTIEDYAFAVCTGLKTVSIPDSVISIGNGAFSCCESLESIYLPNDIYSIGNNTFYNCGSLTTIRIPDNVKKIGNEAFAHCYNLVSIQISKNVTSIGELAFMRCGKLSSIYIPDSVKFIGDGAFSCCESLTSIHLPTGITSIGKDLFYLCKKLKSIIVPNNVTTIGEQAFWFTDLKSINFPDSISSIGEGAFGNTLLDTIYIPVGTKSKFEKLLSGWNMWGKKFVEYYTIEDVLKNVANGDLENAWTDEFGVKYSQDKKRLLKASENGMTHYSIRQGTKVICNSAFDLCSDLETIYIPSSVTTIGDGSFNGCSNLKSIDCPDSVSSIGNRAFFGCKNLSTIRLSANVTNIGHLAFCYCESISNIKIPSIINRIGRKVFAKCDSLTSIQIPVGSKRIFESLLPEYKDKLVEKK